MLTQNYTVKLDAFEGPLDLLLFLIKKSEVDIHDIPVASITEQYLALVGQLRDIAPGRIDIDLAGEFLVMAATLMELKSRMLSAGKRLREPGTDAEAPSEDPRAELVRQLIDYKRYRDAGEALERRGAEWSRRFPVRPASVNDEALREALEAARDVELDDLDLVDLAEAFRRIAETVNFDRLGDHQVTYDDTPIEVHAEDILTQITTRSEPGEMEFRSLFKGRTRPEMLGLFLALLELIRKRRVGVRQDRIDGQIYVAVKPEDSTSDLEHAGGSSPA
ncbi:MAG: segregation and condensation protein A [Phycisphaerae bacterium]|nr:MAG: segregation and condensation protein A [Phycisphaerae bacterium]